MLSVSNIFEFLILGLRVLRFLEERYKVIRNIIYVIFDDSYFGDVFNVFLEFVCCF